MVVVVLSSEITNLSLTSTFLVSLPLGLEYLSGHLGEGASDMVFNKKALNLCG